MENVAGFIAIGAGLAVGLAGIGTGIGQGAIGRGALEALARNPEMKSDIKTNMILAMGIAESAAIYGLLIGGALTGLAFMLGMK